MKNKLNEKNYQNLTEGDQDDRSGFDSAAIEGNDVRTRKGADIIQFNEEPTVRASNPTFRKAIRWLIYVTAFLIPLWFLPFTADVLDFNKQVLLIITAGAGLALYLLDMIKSGAVRYKASVFYWPVLGLVVAGIVSVAFSVNRAVSLFGVQDSRSTALVTLISLAVIFFLAVNTIEDRGKALKKIILGSWALAFLFGVLQILGLSVFKNTVFASLVFNSVGSINVLGMLAALALTFFVSPGLTKKTNNKSGVETGWPFGYLRYAIFALALFFLALVNWWPVWVVAFVSLLVSVALTSVNEASLAKGGLPIQTGRIRPFALPTAVIILGVFLMLINFDWMALKSKLPIEISPSHRVSWKIASSSLRTRPLGHGAENFVIAFDKFKPAGIANSVFYQARFVDAASEAANLVTEGGVLFMLVLLLFIWFYGKEAIGRIKNGFYVDGEMNATWSTGAGFFVAFFLYQFNIVMMSSLFFLLILVALSSLAKSRDRVINLENNAKYSFAGSLVFIAGLILVLIAGYFTVKNYMASIYLANALKSGNDAKAIEYLVNSANANPNDAGVYRLLSQTILVQLAEELKNGPKKDESRESYNSRIQNQIASVVDVAIKATNVSPADSQNWANRGLVYESILTLVEGAGQAAINNYNQSLVLNPAAPNAYLRIGNVHLATSENLQKALNGGRIQSGTDLASVRKQISAELVKAEENFKKAIALYNNFGQALYNLAVVYDRQNKLPDAIKQFEKLMVANPRDPSIAFQIGLLYYRNNQKNNALAAWQQAVTLFPSYSNARWYLSLIYEERGDLASALKQAEEIGKFNSDNELVKQRLAQLRAGQRTIPPEKVLDKKPLDQ